MSTRLEVKKFILGNFLFTEDVSALSDEASLVRGGIIDSTGILELIMFLEERFSIRIRPEEMVPENFDSVDRVAQFIERRLGAREVN
jgi:acyl carrier protein